ncbi:hypothetical protein E1162_18120 [Rhodobacteraceae bacterium RKSG542]|uniref:AzlD family protein n=1 Tax=Pseudovibrio flavus TaxID=2529854 RepID=UPI0012BC46D4|nr:AzlD domain-containing protein [Pseudovibrio flavus]MTI19163.1 hypothetical protein [Pseudovibrio flavus]
MAEPWYAVDLATFLTIVAMAVGTYATRLGGLVLLRFFHLTGRVEAALKAVPPAILMSIVAPTAIATGIPETAGTIVTALAALRLPLLPAIALGVTTVALLRLTPLATML